MKDAKQCKVTQNTGQPPAEMKKAGRPPRCGDRLPARTCHRLSEFAQLGQQFVAGRYRALRIDLGVTHHAFGINHVGRAFVHAALLVENAKGFADRAMRPVIG